MITINIGIITHYYDKLGVGIIKLSSVLKTGDSITIKNKAGDAIFSQTIESIQIDRQEVPSAKKGDEVGVKLDKPVQKGWQAYT